jgi:hypothetical protein
MCIVHGVASVLEVCLICRPIAAQWDPDVKGKCGNQIVSVTIEVTGMDIAILVSPLPRLLYLPIEKWRKLKFVFILDVGAV